MVLLYKKTLKNAKDKNNKHIQSKNETKNVYIKFMHKKLA